jgi:hypothetical protein
VRMNWFMMNAYGLHASFGTSCHDAAFITQYPKPAVYFIRVSKNFTFVVPAYYPISNPPCLIFVPNVLVS